MKRVETRQWIRDLKPHCTVAEMADFLRSKPVTVVKWISQLDLFNDAVIRRRHHRQRTKVTRAQRALKGRAVLSSILPMGFTDAELSRRVPFTPGTISKIRPTLGYLKYMTDDNQRPGNYCPSKAFHGSVRR